MDLVGVRDIAVVVLGAVALITTLVIVITGLLLWRLVATIRADTAPIIGAVRDTVQTVQATVDTVSHAVTESTRSTPKAAGMARRLLGLIRGRFS